MFDNTLQRTTPFEVPTAVWKKKCGKTIINKTEWKSKDISFSLFFVLRKKMYLCRRIKFNTIIFKALW